MIFTWENQDIVKENDKLHDAKFITFTPSASTSCLVDFQAFPTLQGMLLRLPHLSISLSVYASVYDAL